MNVRQLEAFRATMITGSVTGAGKMLHVSQPAVSQLLQQLEAKCGFPLFERHHSRLAPTREANVLFEEVQRMFGAVERVSRIAAGLRDGSWGSFGIAAFPAFSKKFLPEVVASYCSQRPHVQVTVESRRSRSLIDWVASQQIDFGIGTLPSDRPDVNSRHLGRFEGVCVMPRNHSLAHRSRLALADLAGERFVSLGREDRSRLIIDKLFEELQIPRKLQIEAPQSDVACALVMEGAGVSLVDPFSAYNAEGRLVAKSIDPSISFDIWLLSPAARGRLGIVDDFIQLLTSRLDSFELLPVHDRDLDQRSAPC